MSLINVSNMTFSYEGSYDDIFTDVSFQIDTAWKLGFCGRNGRGKTTFLKLLMGEFEYRGSITSSVKFDYFPFPVTDKSLNTMSILTAIAKDAPTWQIQKEISLLDITEDALYRPFQTLSNGEQTKTLLAGLFLRGDNFPAKQSFVLIDEPTNHLDISGRETVADYLNSKSGFIVVSHDRSFLDTCTTHILSINKANIEVIKGNFSTWIENKERQDNFELAENEKLKKDIKRLQLAAKQSEDWSNKAESAKMGKGAAKARKKGNDGMDMMAYNAEKSRRMQQRRKNLERRQQSAIEDKSKLLKNLETADDLKIFPLTYHTSRLITVEGLEVTYDNRKIINDLSFSLMQGDRIALRGSNGSGKSSLLKLICGEDIPHTGLITISSKLVISYVPQDTSFLAGDLKSHTDKHQIDETLFKSILRKLDFSRVQFEKDMRDFSAGQKRKVLLATSLCQKAHVYIWDEPLNYIDVLSRMQIEDLILKYQPTLLFVEHDRTFCEKIATKTMEL